MGHTLSKSDFKAAYDCRTKLYYRELGYPRLDEEDPFLELLADGGYMVERLAKLLVPGAVDVDRGRDLAAGAAATREALRAEEIALLEATFIRDARLARVDILIKRGDAYDLIEVKSGGCNSRLLRPTSDPAIFLPPARGSEGLPGKWRDYVLDAAFQLHLLRDALGDRARIRPLLQMPDKAKTTTDDLLHRHFSLRRVRDGAYDRIAVEFHGDVEALRAGEHFLTSIDISAEVDARLDEVRARAAELAASLVPAPVKLSAPIGVGCGGCEFRVDAGGEKNGFRECWGALADVTPHLLDLHYVGAQPVRARADALIQAGRATLFDLERDDLRTKKGELSDRGARQWRQIEAARSGAPWIGAGLRAALERARYPLHFIDFETSTLAVPYHAGMHPWETVTFQWSCHRVAAPGALPEALAWINVDDVFPNPEFAASLRAALGDAGSVLTWSGYELTILNAIARQGHADADTDAAFTGWVAALEGERLLDMLKICQAHYLHPAMRGSYSIKDVLDAIWRDDGEVRTEFPEYARATLDPYAALPPVVVDGREFAVTEGQGAVRAYQAMLYGEFRDDPTARARLREALGRYCALDTAAMVMIWRYWERAAGLTRSGDVELPPP